MDENLDLKLNLKGINSSIYAKYDVLCLPENYGSHEHLDAAGTLDLYKELKTSGLSCANSFDLGLKSQTINRRGDDLWLGQIFIINDFVIPLVMSILEQYVSNYFSISNNQVILTEEPKVNVELKLNKNGKITKIKFDGKSEDLLKIIKAFK